MDPASTTTEESEQHIQPSPAPSANPAPNISSPTIPMQPAAVSVPPVVPPQASPQVTPSLAPEPQHVVGDFSDMSRPKLKLKLLMALSIIIVLGVCAFLLLHHAPKPSNTQTSKSTTATTTTPNSTNTAQQDSENVSRKDDVSALDAGVGNYISNNGGTLPQSASVISKDTIAFCGESCSADASAPPTELGYYKASAISFRAYSRDLSVPDAATVYIVDNATCNNDTIGAQAPRSVAMLFALQQGAGTRQQCEQY